MTRAAYGSQQSEPRGSSRFDRAHQITPRRFRLRMGPVCIAFETGGWNRCLLKAISMTSLDAVRARFARNEGLPFADIVTEANILDVLNEHGVQFRDRVFNPITTIWGFLSQVLSEDHSCRDTVSRVIAHRAANGETVCSPNTASYCNARSRILTKVLRTLATRTAEELQASVADQWKWNGRSVFIFDGSSVSMPDTSENRAKYPQPPTQQPELDFPLGPNRGAAIARYRRLS
jgi:hypothetical protein